MAHKVKGVREPRPVLPRCGRITNRGNPCTMALGHGGPTCRGTVRTESRRENQRLSHRNWRLRVAKEYKAGRVCMDCGGSFHHSAMDFDHRPGEAKLFDISSKSCCAWPKLVAEVAKCDLVCSNCHRVRTWVRLRGSL